MSALQST